MFLENILTGIDSFPEMIEFENFLLKRENRWQVCKGGTSIDKYSVLDNRFNIWIVIQNKLFTWNIVPQITNDATLRA